MYFILADKYAWILMHRFQIYIPVEIGIGIVLAFHARIAHLRTLGMLSWEDSLLAEYSRNYKWELKFVTHNTRNSRQLDNCLVMIFSRFLGNVITVMKQNSLTITHFHNAIKLIYHFQRVWWMICRKE